MASHIHPMVCDNFSKPLKRLDSTMVLVREGTWKIVEYLEDMNAFDRYKCQCFAFAENECNCVYNERRIAKSFHKTRQRLISYFTQLLQLSHNSNFYTNHNQISGYPVFPVILGPLFYITEKTPLHLTHDN